MTFAVRTLLDAGPGGGGPPPATFVPVTHSFSAAGSFVETIPGSGSIGPVQLVIELGGPGGGGSFSPYMTRTPPAVSGSGGSGALSRYTIPLTSTDWGKTFNVTISPGADGGDPVVNFSGRNAAACVVTNGSFSTPLNMQAGGGQGGTWNMSPVSLDGGAGGVASGGQVNLNGNSGQGQILYPPPPGPRGGVGIVGNLITSGAGGDSSAVPNGFGSSGQTGIAAFGYT